MKIKVNIEDNEKFNRFLFNFKKDKIKVEKIYFTYQYNNNTEQVLFLRFQTTALEIIPSFINLIIFNN